MPDVVQSVRVPFDGGRVWIVKRLGQHLWGVVAEHRSVHIVRFGERGVTVGYFRTTRIVPAVERGLALRLVALGVLEGEKTGQMRVMVKCRLFLLVLSKIIMENSNLSVRCPVEAVVLIFQQVIGPDTLKEVCFREISGKFQSV